VPIAQWNGLLHAFARVRGRAARIEASQLAHRVDLHMLPLAGVPVAVEDRVAVAGEVMWAGSRAADHRPQQRDHEVVSRLRAAGAQIVGTTAVAEGGLWPVTDNPHGVTRNPWNRAFSAGGSSGGSAAAVAAGLVPVAHASDRLGSIRIPAAVCGLVGVRPGRINPPPSDASAESCFSLSEHGALATSVEDAALMLSVIAERPDLAIVNRHVHGLRLGVTVNPPLRAVRVDSEVMRVTFEVANALRTAGARVRLRHLHYPPPAEWAGLVRWFALAVPTFESAWDPARLQPRTTKQARIGRLIQGFVGGNDAEDWRQRALGIFDSSDVLMSPVLAKGTLPARTWSARSWNANVVNSIKASGGYTALWSMAGLPTVAVPAGLHAGTGMPIGIQLVGPPGSESLLLSVASLVETGRPWTRYAPGYI